MKCTQINEHIDDYVDGTLPMDRSATLDAHLAACADCAGALAKAREWQSLLRAMPVPAASPGFAERALRVAAERHRGLQHRQGFIKGFGSAMAAGLALWAVVALYPASRAPEGLPALAGVSIALNGTQQVKVAFNTVRALPGAKITLQLPDHVALEGYPGERELTWTADLAEGDNVLTLPVIGQRVAQGELVARIEHANKVRTVRIRLDVDNGGVSGLRELDLQQV